MAFTDGGTPVSGSGWDEPLRRATARWWRLMGGATETWLKPGLVGAQELAGARERLTTTVVDGLLGRMQGQSIAWTISGRTLRGIVGEIRVRRSGMKVTAAATLDDVAWGQWPFENVSATAASIRSDLSSPGRLKAFEVDVVGLTRLRPLLAHLSQRLPTRTLELDRDGRITIVRHRFGPRAIIEDARVEHGRLEIKLHSVSWCGMRVKPPTRLGGTRFIELPALPLDASIVGARRDGDTVHVRATVPSMTWSVGLDGVRLDRHALH